MQELVARIMQWRPVRAFLHFGQQKGDIFSGAMTLSAFFSIFAALFIAFAIFAAVLGDDPVLQDAVISSIASAMPGLIDTGSGGAIDVDALTGSRILGWAGAVAAVSMLMTAISWLGSSREGFRAMLDLPTPRTNAVLLKLVDLASALGIGVAVLVSAALSVVTTDAATALGIGWVGTVVGIVLQLALDTGIVLIMYRFVGRLRLPAKTIVPAAVLCAIGFFALKLLAGQLLGGADKNPLLASVATVVGIVIWLGFINRVLLLVLAFVAVGPVGRSYSRLARVREAQLDGPTDADRRQQAKDALDEERRRRAAAKAWQKRSKRLRG